MEAEAPRFAVADGSRLAPERASGTFSLMRSPRSRYTRAGLAVLIGLATAPAAGAQEQRYFDWASLPFPADEFLARRASFAERLLASGDGVFLAPSIDGVSGGETFRQQNTFMYFTGLELPRSMLVIASDGDVVLFAPRRDPRFENPSRANDFPGRPLGDDPALGEQSGISDIRPAADLRAFLASLVADGVPLYIDKGRAGNVEAPKLSPHLNWDARDGFHAWIRAEYPRATLRNAFALVAAQRMVKTDSEVERMRTTARLTADAITAAAAHVRPGVSERELEGEFERACKRGGSQRVAFSSIIKSGPNSLWPWRVLASHYDRRNREMLNGELVIFDVGCELDAYVSDVGRTFPVSGTFTAAQRDILTMVTAIADSIIAAIRPGVTFRELRDVAQHAMPPAHSKYMMVGSFYGHHLGLDTGDPSLLDAPLRPGMIFTVEPWYYNHDIEIAVFVEDEVLVTSDGAELLTRMLPRTPEGLEALMRR